MNPFLVIFVGLIIAVTVEKVFTRTQFTRKQGWMTRAIIFNSIQLLMVIVAGYTWDLWLGGTSLFTLPWSPLVNGIFAYIVTTWIFYWWHVVRHENNILWLVVHQFHHSPVRIEAITSFYKHPIEIFINSWIITILTGPILGLDSETNAWLTVFTGLAEFIYHLNVSTPWWIGFIIQRPEAHLFHHKENRQYTHNYGDLSVWDLLGGTFLNPTDEETKRVRTGFTDDKESNVVGMLFGQNQLPRRIKKFPPNTIKCFFISLLFLLGALNILGLIFRSERVRGLAIVSTASPLPFVFTSFKGVETFSTTIQMDVSFKNGTSQSLVVDHKLYANLKGPYNRRNVIGAIFSHGMFFDDQKMIQIRNQVLDWGFCQGHLTNEFGINDPVEKVVIVTKSKTVGNEGKVWSLDVVC